MLAPTIYSICATPNDTDFDEQWGVEKIQLPQAWDINKGRIAVLVGVLDTGINASHPDLSGKVNSSLSRDFLSGSAAYIPNLTDMNGHGTIVAGIIAANTNNNKGIAGAAWQCRLVDLRTMDANGSGNSARTVAAINYAQQNNIPILNLSLTGSNATDYVEAINNYSGLVVCAAGNNGTDNDANPVYPANHRFSNVISVGGSTWADERYPTSNYGQTTVDIFAPGVGIYSTTFTGAYGDATGTSMATPFVAGVAALMLSECPNITAAQIKTKILNSADVVSLLRNKCVCNGRLNAYKALQNAHTYSYTHTASNHTGACSCGERKTESHTFSNVGIQYVCLTCGYRTTTP